MAPSEVLTGLGKKGNAALSGALDSADLWLTTKVVRDFDLADFIDWPASERDRLAREVAAFRSIAEKIPADASATASQSRQARKHLNTVIDIVRRHLLPEWIGAQQEMLSEATLAAKAKGWFVETDEKRVTESLLGTYSAPRMRIRTRDLEVVLDPIARFGSGRKGIVDLVVMPSYQTVCIVTFKDGRWQLQTRSGPPATRPFNSRTLVDTLARLADN
jgi:hypothetical protein